MAIAFPQCLDLSSTSATRLYWVGDDERFNSLLLLCSGSGFFSPFHSCAVHPRPLTPTLTLWHFNLRKNSWLFCIKCTSFTLFCGLFCHFSCKWGLKQEVSSSTYSNHDKIIQHPTVNILYIMWISFIWSTPEVHRNLLANRSYNMIS